MVDVVLNIATPVGAVICRVLAHNAMSRPGVDTDFVEIRHMLLNYILPCICPVASTDWSLATVSSALGVCRHRNS